jgi:hypothetical protein
MGLQEQSARGGLVAVGGQRRAIMDAELGGADDLVEEASGLAGVARHLGHALLVVVQFFQGRHRQVDVVFLKAVETGGIVQQDVGIENEQLVQLLAGFARHRIVRVRWVRKVDDG